MPRKFKLPTFGAVDWFVVACLLVLVGAVVVVAVWK
jgi:hypothetical protein